MDISTWGSEVFLGENDSLVIFRRGLAGKGVVMWSLGLGLRSARERLFTGLHSFLAGNVGFALHDGE